MLKIQFLFVFSDSLGKWTYGIIALNHELWCVSSLEQQIINIKYFDKLFVVLDAYIKKVSDNKLLVEMPTT